MSDVAERIDALADEAEPLHLSFVERAVLFSRHYSFGRWWEDELNRIIEESDASRRTVVSLFLDAADYQETATPANL